MKFDRLFMLVSYEISHGLLLLRSGKSPANPKRIDILFQDVRAIECRTVFDGLIIEEVDPSFLNSAGTKARDVIEPGHKVYKLMCEDWVGYVVGGIVSQSEDNEEFFEPSGLINSYKQSQ